MRKNSRADITIVEIFRTRSDQNELVPAPVPSKVRIDYFTLNRKNVWTCLRDGDNFRDCQLSQDGMSLICHVALSRVYLGEGPLLKIVRSSAEDASFPESKRNTEWMSSTGIDLWKGPSDAGEMESESVLSDVILRYGYSAYRLAVLNGFVGTEEQWLASLVGPQGSSAYQVAVAEGFEGSVTDWLASLTGPQGDSAYRVAVQEGFEGTVADWLASLTGPQGDSAYRVAVQEGFEGTVADWLASLRGPVGATPDITVGTVTTGEPGTPASASMAGTPEAPVLNLVLPRGMVGETPAITIGTVTTGEPGTPAVVTITGTPEAPVLNITIPRGAQGNTGSSLAYPFELVNNLTTADATKALSAAQGVVLDGKISQLSSVVSGGVSFDTIDLSSLEHIERTIDGTTGKWAATSAYYGGFFPVSPRQVIKITKGTISGYYTVLKDNAHISQTSPHYATGYSSRVMVQGDSQFVVPDDGAFIYVILLVSSGVVNDVYECGTEVEGLAAKVSEMSGHGKRIDDLEETTESQGQELSALKTNTEEFDETLNGREEEDELPIDLSSLPVSGAYIYSATNKWQINANAECVFLPVTDGQKYIIMAPSNRAGTFAVLKTNTFAQSESPDFSATFPSLITVEAGAQENITIPADAHYLYVHTRSANSGAIGSAVSQIISIIVKGLVERVRDLENKTPDTPEIDANVQQLFDSIPIALDANGWEIPTTPGMAYALKKAAQATQISYNALAKYPTLSSSDGAAAGEHTGFPYSSTKETRKAIGIEVSFRTFMTAVQNVYGLFYTEDINYSHKQSGYDYDYDGTNCGPYYGMVCSILTGYALGWDIPFDTDQFAYLARIGVLVKVSNQTPQGVHICDLIWYKGHTAMVTGVQRDQYGNVIKVRITEALGAVHSTEYTVSQFETYLHTTHNAIIYRPTNVYANTYTPSEFVAVRGESAPEPYAYNYDICHYAGDYSAMRTDQPTWINYTLGNYTGMKIYKGDSLLETIPLDGSLHKVDVSSYMLGAGKYSACLTDGTNDSEPTHWELVDAGCTYEDNGTKQKISFVSNYGNPWWVQVCSSRGVAYCWYRPMEEDIENGYCELDLAAMIAEQYTGKPVGTTFVRVMYRADYGGVASEMVQITD